MAINWELGVAPDILGNALNAFHEGRKDKAWQAYAANPNDPAAMNALARYDPQGAIQAQKMQQQQQRLKLQADAEAAKQKQEHIVTMGKLLDHATDETTYQQSLAAAKQYGIPVDGAPPNFDPAWINQQKMIVSAVAKDGGAGISGLAKELEDAGYKRGTPEFQAAMVQGINGKYGSDYVDDQGNVRRRSPLNIGAPHPAQQQGGELPPVDNTPPAQGYGPNNPAPAGDLFTFDMYKSARDIQGKDWADKWVSQNGFRVRVATPQQARSLPSGTPITLPDGSEGVVP